MYHTEKYCKNCDHKKIILIKSGQAAVTFLDFFWFKFILGQSKHDLSDVGGDRYISQYYFLEYYFQCRHLLQPINEHFKSEEETTCNAGSVDVT